MRPIWPSDIAAVNEAPAVNCPLANSFIDTSGVAPRDVSRRSQATNTLRRKSEIAIRIGTTESPPGATE